MTVQNEIQKTYQQHADHPYADRLTFFFGMKSGLVIALGYVPIAITFGLLAQTLGVPPYIGMMMSIFIFAGASQFVGIKFMSLGVSPWGLIVTAFLINFRYFLMSSSLSQKIEQTNPGKRSKWLYLLAFGLTDETFVIASLRPEEKLPIPYILGLNAVVFCAWNLGTWIGLFGASAVPQSIQTSMGIGLYAMFIGLLVPSLKKSKPAVVISVLSILASLFFHSVPVFQHISDGWIIVIVTVLIASLGAILFPKEESA